ncbi:MAG: hypothetical protein WKF70_12200 [Chitinophagaceae bacterium]
MKQLYSLLLLALILFTLGACKTANKAYDKGQYHNAIDLALRKLQKDPHNKETKLLLQNAYQFAVNNHEAKIRSLSQSQDEFRYEYIYNEYHQLQQLYRKLRERPSTAGMVNLVDYSEYESTYREKTAEVYLQKGLALMETDNKENYRKAYHLLRNALSYRTGDQTIRQKMSEAYELAVVNIVLLPIDNYHNRGYNQSAYYPARNFETGLIQKMRQQIGNEFIAVHSKWEAQRSGIEPDEILELRLGRMEIGRPHDEYQTRTVSREIVTKEIVYRPDSVVKEYSRVSADITTTRRSYRSEGELYASSRNKRGQLLWNDLFRGEHRWQTEFVTYRGDVRALSDNDRSLMNGAQQRAPGEDEIAEHIFIQIENELAQRIRQHYHRY